MMRAMASAFRMRTVRVFPFWTKTVKANIIRMICATVSAFWTRSVFVIRMQHVLQMQSFKVNGTQMRLTKVHST